MTDVLAEKSGGLAVPPGGSGPDAAGSGLDAALRDVTAPDGCFIATSPTGSFAEAWARGRDHRLAWLPVRAEAGWVLIGPAVRPGLPGCPTCLRMRRDGNRAGTAARRELAERHGPRVGEPRLLPVVSGLVATLAAEEAARGFPRTAGSLLRVSTQTGAVTRHRLIADPLCPDCGDRPDDRPRQLRLHSAPKPSPSVFRVRELPADLEDRYVDAETGLLGSLGTNARTEPLTAVARRMPGHSGHDSHHGYGRAFDAASAIAIAITEALERHAAGRPRGRRPVVRARYADIAGDAIDPRTLGLYPDSWYDQPGFAYAGFDENREASWVWGYSLAASRPVLVPLNFAYHGAATKADPRWAYETSNGAAVGNCLAEAIFHGLLEIAERDSFLMTWYGRLPVPKLDLATVPDRRIPLLAARARQDFGYELMAFAMSTELGIPAFWTMAVNGGDAPGRRHALCAAGAHVDPERALRSALLELLPRLASGAHYDEEASAAMLADPDLVTEMEQHQQVYFHPGAWDRLEFLPGSGPGRPLADLARPWPSHADLADDLAELVGRYLASGLDVVAVDTTCPELSEGGFAAAKVIVPGTVPMAFGHRYRRVHGLPRLLTVPRLLGYTDRDLRPDDLNPHPHPFP
jgi:ribosomal protein S12 methylthiotransferase accessory factor